LGHGTVQPVAAYNEFLFALVLTGPDTKTLPVAIADTVVRHQLLVVSAAARSGIMLPIVAFMMLLTTPSRSRSRAWGGQGVTRPRT